VSGTVVTVERTLFSSRTSTNSNFSADRKGGGESRKAAAAGRPMSVCLSVSIALTRASSNRVTRPPPLLDTNAGGLVATRSVRPSSETRTARHFLPGAGRRLQTTTANQPSLPSTESSRSSGLTRRTCESSCSSSRAGSTESSRPRAMSSASTRTFAGEPMFLKTSRGRTLSSGRLGLSSQLSPSASSSSASHGVG
jgi:hypothetical protein